MASTQTDKSPARATRRTVLFGVLFAVLGVVCFILKALSPETIDTQGVLHERFFLLPVGYALILVGLVFFVVAALQHMRDSADR